MALPSEEFLFGRGFPKSRDWLGFVLKKDDIDEEETPNSQLGVFRSFSSWVGRVFEWSAVDIVAQDAPQKLIVVLGRDGPVYSVSGSVEREEIIESQGTGPEIRGPMRALGLVDGDVYAVGMGRQVYRRDENGGWILFERGLPDERPVGKVLGFNALDGFSRQELIVVGWGGEIWEFDGTKWREVSSPTNAALFDVCCTSDGRAFACGQAGALLVRDEVGWSSVQLDKSDSDFRSVREFGGKLFIADGETLYKYDFANIDVVEFEGSAVPSHHLRVGGGLLLSTAGKEIFLTSDGMTWERVPA